MYVIVSIIISSGEYKLLKGCRIETALKLSAGTGKAGAKARFGTEPHSPLKKY